jgi:hypothetical protein
MGEIGIWIMFPYVPNDIQQVVNVLPQMFHKFWMLFKMFKIYPNKGSLNIEFGGWVFFHFGLGLQSTFM